MTNLTFLDLLHTAHVCRGWGYTIRETMIYLYGLTHGLERYYLE